MSNNGQVGNELNFDDLEPIAIPVRYKKQSYTLKEGTANAVRRFKNFVVKTTKMVDGQIAGMGDVADSEMMLLSECLVDDKGKNVPVPTLLSWPSRVTKPLYEKAQEICGLNSDTDIQVLEKISDKIIVSDKESDRVNEVIAKLQEKVNNAEGNKEKFDPLEHQESSENTSPSVES